MIWNYRYLLRMDMRVIPIIILLMIVSLLVISSHSVEHIIDGTDESFFTRLVKMQMIRFAIGTIVFLFFAGFDYNKLRAWTWFLYILMILSLVGLFFTDSIKSVHRWYKIPLIGFNVQPSEIAKLVVVITLSWFLERRRQSASSFSTAFLACVIVGVPFLLILKQPDLGTALVLFPIALVIFYFGDVNSIVLKVMTWIGAITLFIIALLFMHIVPHDTVRPFATKILKEYQFDRLNPNTHHQNASQTAISIGGITGTGFRKSEYTGRGWLPKPYTDSVFPALGEEFGLLGLVFLLFMFYALIYFSFQVTAYAKDHFGRLLSAGVSVYLAMHILVNIGMMCGFLPITGVPLVLVTYGGSSILLTMAALGILQSIYSRRFMF